MGGELQNANPVVFNVQEPLDLLKDAKISFEDEEARERITPEEVCDHHTLTPAPTLTQTLTLTLTLNLIYRIRCLSISATSMTRSTP
jgi:hypothetical protein